MSALDRCPSCEVEALSPRDLPGNHDRGPVRVFCCKSCGEQTGPALLPVPGLASVVLPISRVAAKLSRASGPCVSVFAPLRGALS